MVVLRYGFVSYRLGYRDYKLMERLCFPMIKSSLLGSVVGLAIGAVLELRREGRHVRDGYYNAKVGTKSTQS
jgi:hypothetical protein